MNLEIRKIRMEDLDRVCEIEAMSFSMPWTREDFAALVDSESSSYFVALADGLVVGCAGYTDNVGEGYINNVATAPEYRGRKIAQALLKEVMKDGNKKCITDFTLEVRVSNAPAVALYEKLGFKSAGIRKRFYEHPVEDAYVMWKREEQNA